MNPVRLDYIRDHICAEFGRDPSALRPLSGLRIVDVGCGGGLLCEPLARLGAKVLGIDAAEEGIAAAKLHADEMALDIEYRAMTAEALAEEGAEFDVVLAMEIVEHVADRDAFATGISALTAPHGLVMLSTLNRTPQSYALAIVGAEYLLRWLPVGTHDWSSFPTPDELARHLEGAGLKVVDRTGFIFNPVTDKWRCGDDLSVNYAMVAVPAVSSN